MSFEYVDDSWIQSASEEDLRSTDDEMVSYLNKIDWDINTEEDQEIYDLHNDIVNAISSRFPLNLPSREHGWYLSNDD